MGARSFVAGVRAALEAPAWIGSPRLAQLLEPNGSQAAGSAPAAPALTPAAVDALRVAFGALRLLARLRRLGGPWCYTCLYRSVAGCLVLRRHGSVATLRLGARGNRAATATTGTGVAPSAGVSAAGTTITGLGMAPSAGVSAAAAGHAGVSAHAWVEDAWGRPVVERPHGHIPLRPHG
jgi:hypothetical protein